MSNSRARVAGVAATIAALPFLLPAAAGANTTPEKPPVERCVTDDKIVVDTVELSETSELDEFGRGPGGPGGPNNGGPHNGGPNNGGPHNGGPHNGGPKDEPKDEPAPDCDEESEPWVHAEKSCDEIVLWLGNNGDGPAVLKVFVDGAQYDYTIAPGTKYDKHIPVTEDSTVALKVRDGDKVDTGNGEDIVYAETVTTDCEQPVAPTTTVAKSEVQPVVATPTTAPTTTEAPAQVLGIQVTAPVESAQLARTGGQSTTNAGIGISLLGLGMGLVTLGRRRKAQA